MKPTDKLLFLIIHSVDRSGMEWHRLPVFMGLTYLATRRHLHNAYNLIRVGKNSVRVGYDPADFPYRTPDGRFNDPSDETAGSIETFFGRNTFPVDGRKKLMKPNPMVVATKLLARKQFIDTGKQFNLIAASWIQFMIHDWMDHLESAEQVEMKAPAAVAYQCPLKCFKYYKTKKVNTGLQDIKKGHLNIRTSWWDGSSIYGSNSAQLHQVRTYREGKLKITNDGLLQHQDNGLPIAGDIRNSWIGVSALQALFILEHNAICDSLKVEYPDLDDENLYRHARLVTSAVMAKIHTIDWTVQLLKTDTLLAGMRANWYGLFGKGIKNRYGHVGGPYWGGLVGLKEPNNHGVPYSLTEDFVSVYRMHSLAPDQLFIKDINSVPGPNKSPKLSHNNGLYADVVFPHSATSQMPEDVMPTFSRFLTQFDQFCRINMVDLIGVRGEEKLSEIGFTTLMVSMGHQPSGALELWNYPMWLRDVVPHNVDGTDRSDHVDLASLEIYRDRERNVPRYNEFRRSLFLIPISKWSDLTDKKEAIDTLQEVYGDDVEQLDLMVGMLAEKKIKGFAISETAFEIFLLMASRRLEADRFFTSDFNEKVYTQKGLNWVNTTESLKDVLDRHYPEMTYQWMNSSSAFTVWDAPPDSNSPIPFYLRIPR